MDYWFGHRKQRLRRNRRGSRSHKICLLHSFLLVFKFVLVNVDTRPASERSSSAAAQASSCASSRARYPKPGPYTQRGLSLCPSIYSWVSRSCPSRSLLVL